MILPVANRTREPTLHLERLKQITPSHHGESGSDILTRAEKEVEWTVWTGSQCC